MYQSTLPRFTKFLEKQTKKQTIIIKFIINIFLTKYITYGKQTSLERSEYLSQPLISKEISKLMGGKQSVSHTLVGTVLKDLQDECFIEIPESSMIIDVKGSYSRLSMADGTFEETTKFITKTPAYTMKERAIKYFISDGKLLNSKFIEEIKFEKTGAKENFINVKKLNTKKIDKKYAKYDSNEIDKNENDVKLVRENTSDEVVEQIIKLTEDNKENLTRAQYDYRMIFCKFFRTDNRFKICKQGRIHNRFTNMPKEFKPIIFKDCTEFDFKNSQFMVFQLPIANYFKNSKEKMSESTKQWNTMSLNGKLYETIIDLIHIFKYSISLSRDEVKSLCFNICFAGNSINNADPLKVTFKQFLKEYFPQISKIIDHYNISETCKLGKKGKRLSCMLQNAESDLMFIHIIPAIRKYLTNAVLITIHDSVIVKNNGLLTKVQIKAVKRIIIEQTIKFIGVVPTLHINEFMDGKTTSIEDDIINDEEEIINVILKNSNIKKIITVNKECVIPTNMREKIVLII